MTYLIVPENGSPRLSKDLSKEKIGIYDSVRKIEGVEDTNLSVKVIPDPSGNQNRAKGRIGQHLLQHSELLVYSNSQYGDRPIIRNIEIKISYSVPEGNHARQTSQGITQN